MSYNKENIGNLSGPMTELMSAQPTMPYRTTHQMRSENEVANQALQQTKEEHDKPFPERSLSIGVKFDQDKLRFELISPEFLEELSSILTFGAKKYQDRNWERGMEYSRVFGALMRHLWAWWKSKKPDTETGKSHLSHAACCLMFLIHYERNSLKYGNFDDSPANKSDYIPPLEALQREG